MMTAAFSVGSVPTCDLSLLGLSLREREALMSSTDWGLLIDRALWEHMTPTERDRARAEWERPPARLSARSAGVEQ
jgi:hypothetical protein